MIKKILIVGGVIAGVAVIGCAVLGWWAYLVFTGPLYEPGSLAHAPGLQPPARGDDATTWLVQRGVRLHQFHRGEGRPILFVHGGPGFPIRQPMPWLDALAADYTVHYYDQRGCGLSSRPFDRFENPNYYANMKQLEATLGLGAQVADLERIRRLLGEERLILVGHSFGGFLAALYAAEFPQRVEKLVLLAPANMLVMPLPEGDDLFTNARDRLPPDRQVEFDGFLEEYLDFGALFDHDEDSSRARRGGRKRRLDDAGDVPEHGSPPRLHRGPRRHHRRDACRARGSRSPARRREPAVHARDRERRTLRGCGRRSLSHGRSPGPRASRRVVPAGHSGLIPPEARFARQGQGYRGSCPLT
ncbi:MAG: alpha/beta fold hydrolase [Planctomycetota bacterium]